MQETNKIPCPCCGKTQVEDYDICEECSWENDPVQLWKPDKRGGANTMCLNEAKLAYKNNEPIE